MDMVKQWRLAQTLLNHLSGSFSKTGDNSYGVWKLDIDGCDESKFKVPRNTPSAKSLDKCWRPQLHLEATILWGFSRQTISTYPVCGCTKILGLRLPRSFS